MTKTMKSYIRYSSSFKMFLSLLRNALVSTYLSVNTENTTVSERPSCHDCICWRLLYCFSIRIVALSISISLIPDLDFGLLVLLYRLIVLVMLIVPLFRSISDHSRANNSPIRHPVANKVLYFSIIPLSDISTYHKLVKN